MSKAIKARPCGHFVLVHVEPVEEKTESGIIIGTNNELEREKFGRDIGTIIAFGPTAFKGFAGCDGPADWGVKVGDKVEFNRYDGKVLRSDDELNHRIINDSDIIVVIEE